MAKRKKSYSATECPDPLNTMIDLAGALAMGAFAKHQIKKDCRRGQGAESAKAATMVYGMEVMRRGSEDLISLSGLYGVNSAIRDIKKSEAAARRRIQAYDDGIDFPPYKTNDNRYAWRLNCGDGSPYGVSPLDYETREAYNRALSLAKGDQSEGRRQEPVPEAPTAVTPFRGSPLLCCRVSRLDNGANEYYLTDDETIKIGDRITVSTDAGTSEGIVIGVKKLAEMTEDELPKDSMWVLTQEDDDGTV